MAAAEDDDGSSSSAWASSLMAYVPDAVLQSLGVGPDLEPRTHVSQGVIAYVHVAGLADVLHDFHGRMQRSADDLDAALFQTLMKTTAGAIATIVARNGGDLLRVKSGGSLYVAAWIRPSNADQPGTTVLRAVKAAADIRWALRGTSMDVQTGIGVGSVHFLHVAGVHPQPIQHVVGGDAVLQAAYALRAVSANSRRAIVLTKQARALTRSTLACQHLAARPASLFPSPLFAAVVTHKDTRAAPFPQPDDAAMTRRSRPDARLEALLLRYTSPLAQIDALSGRWWQGRVVPHAAVLAVAASVGQRAGGSGDQKVHATLSAMQVVMGEQATVAPVIFAVEPDHDGVLVLIGIGLPPHAMPSDEGCARGAIALAQALSGLEGVRGIAVECGEVRCGSVGSDARRDVVVHGDPVVSVVRMLTRALATTTPTRVVLLSGPGVHRVRERLGDVVELTAIDDDTYRVEARAASPDDDALCPSQAAGSGIRFLIGDDRRERAERCSREACRRLGLTPITVHVPPQESWAPLAAWRAVVRVLVRMRNPKFAPDVSRPASTDIVDALCADLCPLSYGDAALLNELLDVDIEASSSVKRRGSASAAAALIALVEDLVRALTSPGFFLTIDAPNGLDAASLLVCRALTSSSIPLVIAVTSARELDAPNTAMPFEIQTVLGVDVDHGDAVAAQTLIADVYRDAGAVRHRADPSDDELRRSCEGSPRAESIVAAARSAASPAAFAHLCASFLDDADDVADPSLFLRLAHKAITSLSASSRGIVTTIAVLGSSAPFASLAMRCANPTALWRDLTDLVHVGLVRVLRDAHVEITVPALASLLAVGTTPGDSRMAHDTEVRIGRALRYPTPTLLYHLAGAGKTAPPPTTGLVSVPARQMTSVLQDLDRRPNHGRRRSSAYAARTSPSAAAPSPDWYTTAWTTMVVKRVAIPGRHYAVSADDGSALVRAAFAGFTLGQLTAPALVVRRPGTPGALLAFLVDRSSRLGSKEKAAALKVEHARRRQERAQKEAAARKSGPPPTLLSADNAIPCAFCDTRLSATLQKHMRRGLQVRVFDERCPHRTHHRVANSSGWMPRAPSLLTLGLPHKRCAARQSVDDAARIMLRNKSTGKRRAAAAAPSATSSKDDLTVEFRVLEPVLYHGWRLQRPKSKLTLMLCGTAS